MPRLFRGSSYANVTATLALVIALGGTSYAAIKLPANSVGSVQVRPGAITSDKVRNGSLLRRDFKPGELPRGARGAAGARGPAGPPGPAGAASPPVAGYAHSDPIAVPAGVTLPGRLACDDGMRVVGGGVYSSESHMVVESSYPASATAWVVYMRNESTVTRAFRVYVICMTATGVMETD
jgi:hypothetical protein